MTSPSNVFGPYALHPYQMEGIFTGGTRRSRGKVKRFPGILPAWSSEDSAIIQMATGTGKTIVMAALASHCKSQDHGRTLVLTERKKLVNQGWDKFMSIGLKTEIESGSKRVLNLKGPHQPDAVIATVQSMVAGTKSMRIERFPKDYFNRIFIDECHHATSTWYKTVLDYFQRYKLLGVTATADRADGRGLGHIFKTVAYEYNLDEAVRENNLKRIRVRRIGTGISLKGIGISRGDFTEHEMAERIIPCIADLAKLLVRYAEGRKTIDFMPDVDSSRYMADALNHFGVTAESVAGADGDKVEGILKAYTAGRYQFMVNNQLLVEGYDESSISCVALLRPTLSRPLFSQMIGRGTRLDPLVSTCLILDFAFLTDAHDPVHPIELFDNEEMHQEILDLASTAIDVGEEVDLIEEMDKAEDVHVEKQRLKIIAKDREIQHHVFEYDVFTATEILGIEKKKYDTDTARYYPANPRQIQELAKFGITDANMLTYKGAKRRLDELKRRSKNDLADFRTVGRLIASDVPIQEAREMSIADSCRTLASVRAAARRAARQLA